MNDKSKVISEGIIIILIPTIAYWFTYLYEYGYFIHFRIPSSFIQISTTILLNTAIIISVIITVLYLSFNTTLHGFLSKKSALIAAPAILLILNGIITIETPYVESSQINNARLGMYVIANSTLLFFAFLIYLGRQRKGAGSGL